MNVAVISLSSQHTVIKIDMVMEDVPAVTDKGGGYRLFRKACIWVLHGFERLALCGHEPDGGVCVSPPRDIPVESESRRLVSCRDRVKNEPLLRCVFPHVMYHMSKWSQQPGFIVRKWKRVMGEAILMNLSLRACSLLLFWINQVLYWGKNTHLCK